MLRQLKQLQQMHRQTGLPGEAHFRTGLAAEGLVASLESLLELQQSPLGAGVKRNFRWDSDSQL